MYIQSKEGTALLLRVFLSSEQILQHNDDFQSSLHLADYRYHREILKS